ncbi:hypothetical protein BKA61DRAFT_721151 [Leptodontidium sp. MPI-SDFR-AT-0119]|nr:hypothetical protein BKA61DRAFT_721151 [Leptodontidium sp. MPI-SDFR-AT-0119]
MYGPASGGASKPKYIKLRASCDTCFLAKVKCSKAGPICSRCLACGADCKYSPSSRAGKSKSDGSHRRRSSAEVSVPEDSNAAQYPTPSMSIDVAHSSSSGMEADWSSTLGSPDESMNQHAMSSTTIPAIGDDEGPEVESTSPHLFDPALSWTNSPRTDMTSQYFSNIHHQRSHSSVDPTVQPSLASWYEQPGYFTSTSGRDAGHNVYMSNYTPKSTMCNCFSACLAALQALHESDAITATSPLDVILTINKRAVETCSTMLNCLICTSKSGSSLGTMLLGTILGRIISIYQDASKNYFALTSSQGQIQQPPLTFGTYQVANEDVRWFQIEIILRDLRKLKELFAKFQETSLMSDREDAGMHGAMRNYLCQSIDLTFESLKKQRSFTGGHL